MRKSTKNKIKKIITVISIAINVLYFTYIIWTGNGALGIWNIPWALAILWLSLFVLANLDSNWLNTNKHSKGYRESKDNSKYYFK